MMPDSAPADASALPPGHPRTRHVGSFDELAAATFADGVNALCWPRALDGDFREVIERVRHLPSDGLLTLDEKMLRRLTLSPAGRVAVENLVADLQRLRDLDRDPVLNCIHGYPRDDEPSPVPTDVFSWHADSAPVPADTWLCTYHGAWSEGLRNEDAQRRIDIPETRAALLAQYGGADDAGFAEYLHENCYDLHYAPRPGAQPYPFGHFNFWRICVDYPDAPVPPCIHRAPATDPKVPRLLLIS